jgi:hypothetical protein
MFERFFSGALVLLICLSMNGCSSTKRLQSTIEVGAGIGGLEGILDKPNEQNNKPGANPASKAGNTP